MSRTIDLDAVVLEAEPTPLLDEVTAEAGDPFAEALREAGLPNEPSSSVLLTQRVKEARALQALWEQLVETPVPFPIRPSWGAVYPVCTRPVHNRETTQ